MRRLLFLFALSVAGCAAIMGGGKKKSAASHDEPSEDQDEGVDHINALLKEFRGALEQKQFEQATNWLRQADKAVKGASEVTKSHPDFEEVEERVAAQKPRLEKAIEDDRIARRNAAIADLIRRGDQLTQRAAVILKELESRVPQKEDLANIDEVVLALRDIEREGSSFSDDERYAAHAKERDRIWQATSQRKQRAEWQINATQNLAKAVDAAYNAVSAAKKATTSDEQLSALRKASDGFSSCVNLVSDFEGQPGYDPKQLADSRLGLLPIGEAKKRCLELGAKVREQGDKLAWQRKVDAVAKKVEDALGKLKAASRAADQLKASDAAVEALGECRAALDNADTLPGFDASYVTQTSLGQLSATRLAKACADERGRLSKSQPGWRWKKELEALAERVGGAKKQLDDAAAVQAPPARGSAYTRAMDATTDCTAQARALAKDREADRRFTVVTALGELDVAGIEKGCDGLTAQAKNEVQKARDAEKLETFLKSCKGDEVEVAKREGMPKQVLSVEGGRVFVYADKSVGFDPSGKRVDFGDVWLRSVERVGGDVDKALGAVKGGADGIAILKATNDAGAVLETCQSALKDTDKNPGFDKARRFDTALGKLGALELRAACGKEATRLAATVPSLKWRIRFEQLRDRAKEAYEQVQKAKTVASADEQVKLIGAALGGYTECQERAETILKEPGADKKVHVPSPFGSIDAGGIGKACKTASTAAKDALDSALIAQKLEAFLKSCKGDESEVAKREGMPSKVEPVGSGRVFVYQGKKAKRFAFDPSGKRVDESALKK